MEKLLNKKITCEGCLEEMLFSPGLHDICWSCVKARHKAAMTGYCRCPRKLRRPISFLQAGSTRTKCERCLGSITQSSSNKR